jgi:hypothetical protein
VLLFWQTQRQANYRQVSSDATSDDGSAECGLFSTEHGPEKARVRVCAVGPSAEVVRFRMEVGAMSEGKKDFYLITGMTESFRAWDKRASENPEWRKSEQFGAELKMWELRFQLAMAQQLSVISANLSQIVGSSKTKG